MSGENLPPEPSRHSDAVAEPLPRSSALLLLGALLIAGGLLRLVGLSYPPYDSHSFRQAETLSTAEAFYRNGIDILHPATIYEGYPGTFVLELPLFQALVASLYRAFGPHIEILRLLNILFGAGTAWVLYRITRLFLDRTTAVFAVAIYAMAPVNILYQRSTLIDPAAVFCALTAFYCMALLLSPENSAGPPRSPGGRWLCFAAFATTSWLAVMIKALYLWPAVLLFAQAWLARRFKWNAWMIRVLAWFALSGVCFLAWNHYAARVNDASLFTRGVRPTSLLGMSALLSPEFYRGQIIQRPKVWLGIPGAVLYLVGLWAAWRDRSKWRSTSMALLILIPPTYLLVFSNINKPHDYYQLIITPFLAIVAGYGLRRLLAQGALAEARASARLAAAGAVGLLVAAGVFTYLVWFHMPRRDAQRERLEQLCAGKVQPWAPGMVFVAYQISGAPLHQDVPEFLYAAKLWGYGRTVASVADAKLLFDKYAPAFPRLDSVVFYGTDCPAWMPAKQFRLAVMDDSNRFYLFQSQGLGLPRRAGGL